MRWSGFPSFLRLKLGFLLLPIAIQISETWCLEQDFEGIHYNSYGSVFEQERCFHFNFVKYYVVKSSEKHLKSM